VGYAPSVRLDVVAPAAFDDRVDDGTAFACVGFPEKQRFFFPRAAERGRISNEVIVDAASSAANVWNHPETIK
jgi:hypothetical protein